MINDHEQKIYKKYAESVCKKILLISILNMFFFNRLSLLNKKKNTLLLDLSDLRLETKNLYRSYRSMVKYKYLNFIFLFAFNKRYVNKKLKFKQFIQSGFCNYKLIYSLSTCQQDVKQELKNIENKCLQLDLGNESFDVSAFTNIISFPVFEKVSVSIIIPVYNQIQYTYNCLKSILNNTKDINYEIILVDDVSVDQTLVISSFVKNITVVRNATNQGFLLNCNNAAKLAKGEYIHLLNNDTQVSEGWLSHLLDVMNRDQSVGLVGSKLVYPDGRLQEAGGIFWNDASAWNFGNKSDPNLPEFNYLKEVDYISGASILIRSSLWKDLGGFDEEYVPAYCEDSDLAFSVRKAGYKVVYQPKSVVVHFEGVSNGTDTNSGIKHYQVLNKEKFYNKWKDILTKEHFNNAENVFLARDRSRNKPCILFIDHYVPTFDKDAGSRTIYQYLKLLTSEGYNVKFIGDNFNKMEPYGSIIEDMGVEILYGVHYMNNWKIWLNDNAKYIKYAFINRPHIAVNYIDEIKSHNIPIVYNVCDLHFLREERCFKLTGNKEHLKNYDKMKKVETELFTKADKVLTLSTDEQNIINNLMHFDKCLIAPIFVYDTFDFEIPNDSNTKDLVFVGSFTHTPNLDAILWFINKVFPFIKERIPNIKINIVGSNVPEELKQLENDSIVIKGFVSDETLKQIYLDARICVIPLRYGAGVKGKTIEAMYNKIPIVSTSIGIEGLENINECLDSFDDPKDFALEVIKMYNDTDYRLRNITSCYSYVYKHYSYEQVKDWFSTLFK